MSSLSRVRSSRPEPEPTPSRLICSRMPPVMAVWAEGSTISLSSPKTLMPARLPLAVPLRPVPLEAPAAGDAHVSRRRNAAH